MTRTSRDSLHRIIAAVALAAAAGATLAGLHPLATAVLAVTLLVVAPGRAGPDALQRPIVEMARCRRYGLHGHVMVASLDRRAGRAQRRRIAEELARALRITDGVAVLDGRQGPLLCSVFSDPRVETDTIERRLRSLRPELGFGWASFPGDGVTLEELLRTAGERSASAPAGARRAPAPPPRRRTELGMQTSSASSLGEGRLRWPRES